MTKEEIVEKILRLEGLSSRMTEGKSYQARLMSLPMTSLETILSGMQEATQVSRHPGLVASPRSATKPKSAVKKAAAKKKTAAKKVVAKKTAAKKVVAKKKTAAKKAVAKKKTAVKKAVKKTAAQKAVARKKSAKKAALTRKRTAAKKKTAAKKVAARRTKKSQKLAAKIHRNTGGKITQVTGKLTKATKARAGRLIRAIGSGKVKVREGWRTPADVPSKSPKERYGLFLAAYEDLRIPRRASVVSTPVKATKKSAVKKRSASKKVVKRSAPKKSRKLSARLRRTGGRVTQVTGKIPKAMKARVSKLVRGIASGRIRVREGWRKPSDVPSQSPKERAALFVLAYQDVRILSKSSRSGAGLAEAYASIPGDKAPYFLQAGYTRRVGGGARGPGIVRAIPGAKAKPFRTLSDADQMAVANFLNGPGRALRGEGAPKMVDLKAIYALTPSRKPKIAKQGVRQQAVRQQGVRQQAVRQQGRPQGVRQQSRRQEPEGIVAGAMNWFQNT